MTEWDGWPVSPWDTPESRGIVEHIDRETLDAWRSAGRRVGRAKRNTVEASEEQRPFDHPFRIAQVCAHIAADVAQPLQLIDLSPDRSPLDRHRVREPIAAEAPGIYSQIDQLRRSLAVAYRAGATALRRGDVPLEQIARVAVLGVPQLKRLTTQRPYADFNIRSGSTPAKDFEVRPGEGGVMLDVDSSSQIWRLVRLVAYDSARRYATAQLAGRASGSEHLAEYFLALRRARTLCDYLELRLIDHLRHVDGLSWERLGTLLTHTRLQDRYQRLDAVRSAVQAAVPNASGSALARPEPSEGDPSAGVQKRLPGF